MGVFSWAESDHSWYIFFSLFSTYALLPLPLLWSIAAGATTSSLHLLLDLCCHYGDHNFLRKVGPQVPQLLSLLPRRDFSNVKCVIFEDSEKKTATSSGCIFNYCALSLPLPLLG